MTFYENTIVARQDLAQKELNNIKDKYNEMGRSNDCVLNIIDGADHDNIWNTNSKNLPNSDYNNLLPLGAALLFIRSM